jgi:hypothetical protein
MLSFFLLVSSGGAAGHNIGSHTTYLIYPREYLRRVIQVCACYHRDGVSVAVPINLTFWQSYSPIEMADQRLGYPQSVM